MHNNKNAFTLAEVLITLGIIGIVAALTIPALIAKYEEMVIVNKLKRTYSEIATALDLRKAELGTDTYADQFNPNLTAAEQLDGFLKYLNVIERCSSSSSGCGGKYTVKPQKKTNDGYGNVSVGRVSGERAILNDGVLIWHSRKAWTGDCSTTYTTYNKDADGNYVDFDSDGNPIPIYYQAQQCAELFFDINGSNGKNQFGYDCYSITVTPSKLNQNGSYGNFYNTIRTGKLDYETYSEGKY